MRRKCKIWRTLIDLLLMGSVVLRLVLDSAMDNLVLYKMHNGVYFYFIPLALVFFGAFMDAIIGCVEVRSIIPDSLSAVMLFLGDITLMFYHFRRNSFLLLIPSLCLLQIPIILLSIRSNKAAIAQELVDLEYNP